TAGRTHHVVTDESEGLPDVEAGPRQMLQQRRRERAVATIAVICGFPLIGGIGNEGVWTRRLYIDLAMSDTAQGKRTLDVLGKGIVAAGIEEDEAQLGCGLVGE